MIHKPVLLKEVLEFLDPKTGEVFVDGTANGGGHTMAIWNMIKPSGKVIAIDKDAHATEGLKKRVSDENASVSVFERSYADFKDIVDLKDFGNISGILLDLGYSSFHVDLSGRGFSFQKDEPLVMRYEADPKDGVTAYDVVNSFKEEDIADIIYKYGEERLSRRIAKKIVEVRSEKKIETSGELAEIVKSAFPKRHFWKIHPATKTFQALRIFVNRELEDLERALPEFHEALKMGGRLAIISFHSMEDRIVKNFFRDNKDKYKILTKKPVTAQKDELSENPRARSAKLRVAEKI